MYRQSAYSAETRGTFWRTLLTFAVTRLLIAVVLLLYLAFNSTSDSMQAHEYLLYWRTCFVYLILALGFVALLARRRRRFRLQLWMQMVVDLAAISVLYLSAGGIRSGLAILYLFPLAGGAILAPMVLALFFAAVTTIVLLGESSYRLLVLAGDTSVSQAGLYGAAFFFAVVVMNRLAARLIREEALARQRGIDLQAQEAINRLIIADMDDGILVVGAQGEILTANPAAGSLLGLQARAAQTLPLTEMPGLAPIADALHAWRAQLTERPGYVVIKPVELPEGDVSRKHRESAVHLKLRFVNVEMPGIAQDRTVVFLQDVTEIENRAQQLKLASMGRLTASIAHEVRNPLSAIAHAASLLGEELADPMHARLLRIVDDNAARLNRMVEDILKLARKAQSHDKPLALASFIGEVVQEFGELHAIGRGMIAVEPMPDYQVRFDPLHLREIVVNLLSNALRYASGRPASIRLFAAKGPAQRVELHVQDDGPPITPEVRAHLFEPFYTTSSKGTGLGLYLARELCLNNDAMIDYEYRNGRDAHVSGRFVITFAAAIPSRLQEAIAS